MSGFRFRLNWISCIAPSCHAMHIMSMPIFYRCIKYRIRCFLLVFCFFTDKTLSWCEIWLVLRMCTSSLLFRRAPPFLPRCCFLSYSFLLRLLALCIRCCSISILFACYLAASYHPIPTSYNPLLVYMLALRVLGMLRLFRVCFSKSYIDMLSCYNFTWYLFYKCWCWK